MTDNLIPIFDGHNDTLLALHKPQPGHEKRTFLAESDLGSLDLPRARRGGLVGGIFAIFAPDPQIGMNPAMFKRRPTPDGWEVTYAEPIDPAYARELTTAVLARALRIEAESDGEVWIVRSFDELSACLAEDAFAMVLHIEGAEAIDTNLDTLLVYHAAGLRSLGLTWSRPNAFGWGVPFKYPGTPDAGPGLTNAGKALVKACNELGVMIDVAHLNERGFWDVAELSNAPLVATHCGAHAISATTRNLTDKQLDAIAASGGVVGTNFHVVDIRPDGKDEADTPLRHHVRHIEYMVERMGIDHVALGSDFDGAKMPNELNSAAALPKLVAALREKGFDEAALRKICHENWLRVLAETWQ